MVIIPDLCTSAMLILLQIVQVQFYSWSARFHKTCDYQLSWDSLAYFEISTVDFSCRWTSCVTRGFRIAIIIIR